MPLASSSFLTILQTLQTEVQSLNLTFNNTVIPVEIKKISQWLQGVSLPALPIILISPDDKMERAVPFTFENEVLVKYKCWIVIIAAGNRDNTVNQDVWLSFRQQIRKMFQWGLQQAGTPINDAFFGEVDLNPPIPRDGALKNYDTVGMGFTIWMNETRRNP